MSTSNPNTSIPLPTLIDLIKSNACALYGRNLTYDIVTSQTKRPANVVAPAKYDGQKVHALLIGYDHESGPESRGKLLRGAYTVGYAVKLLYNKSRVDVDGCVGILLFGKVWLEWE
jgi:hypothetical protein